jgi:ATP-binding cassette, subfamily B, bacterial PglK
MNNKPIDLFISILKSVSTRMKVSIFMILSFSVIVNFSQLLGLSTAIPFISALIKPEIIENSIFLSEIKNYVEQKFEFDFLLFSALVFATFSVLNTILLSITTYLEIKVTQKITRSIQYSLIKHYFNLNKTNYLEKEDSEIKSNILAESEIISFSFLYPLFEIFVKSITVIFAFTTVVIIYPKISLIALSIIVFFYSTIFIILKKKLYNLSTEVKKLNVQHFRNVHNFFALIKELILNNTQEIFYNDTNRIHNRFVNLNSFAHTAQRLPKIYLELILILTIIFLSLFVIPSNENFLIVLSVFAIVAYRIGPYASHIYSYAVILSSKINNVYFIKNDLDNFKLNEKKFDKLEKIQSKIIPENVIELEINDYKFKNIKVLNNQNLKFDLNKINIIYGPTGSGKSTLLNLIIGFADRNKYKIYVDNLEIQSDEDWHKFRKSISYVSQKSQLLHGSIKDNILFGREFNKTRYERIKKIACIDFTNDIERDDTFLIYDNGKNLSGGQAQRISIARSLYSEPDLLILDEATNQLNEEIEKQIILNIQENSNSKILIVTHNKKLKNYIEKFNEFKIDNFIIKKINEKI